jgi:adenylosuccinate synthase
VSVWVVVGGQYGSEGKGKIAAFITLKEGIDICVRCGGPNSGHCFVDEHGTFRALRQIPTGYIRPETRLMIPPGGLIDLEILQREIESLHLGPERVSIDYRAMIIDERDKEAEGKLLLRERLSSTLCGVGSAVARKVLRGDDVVLAGGAAGAHPWLKPFLADVPQQLNEALVAGKKILVEGTQGLGLSLYHSTLYPKATSRDTSAAGCISECGLSPMTVTNVVLTLRTFPIRVAGQQAGPLTDEVDWDTVRNESGCPQDLHEFTTVTGKLRRVARFDSALARRAIEINRPTAIALNFIDYFSYTDRETRRFEDLSNESRSSIARLEHEIGARFSFLGVGPELEQTIIAPGTGTLHETKTAEELQTAQTMRVEGVA